MSADEIREIIRQELAAFFSARPIDESVVQQPDGLTVSRIRSAVRSDLAQARAKKEAKRRAA